MSGFLHQKDLASRGQARKSEVVNLHDWIDELSDVLDLEDVEVDEGLPVSYTQLTLPTILRV